ncbi:MAG: hypothetical protein ACI957_005263, partial [Verrucomicrobiales bacterium]
GLDFPRPTALLKIMGVVGIDDRHGVPSKRRRSPGCKRKPNGMVS